MPSGNEKSNSLARIVPCLDVTMLQCTFIFCLPASLCRLELLDRLCNCSDKGESLIFEKKASCILPSYLTNIKQDSMFKPLIGSSSFTSCLNVGTWFEDELENTGNFNYVVPIFCASFL